MHYIRIFFDESTANYIDDVFCDNSKVLVKQFPSGKDSQETVDSSTFFIVMKLRNMQYKNPIDQMNLSKIFSEIE